MRIEKKKLSELIPATYNPRNISKKELEKLKTSIKEFGYIEPIIWNATTGKVVGGHQRLKALTELGYDEIECIVIECSEDREKALNVMLNKVSGTWNKNKLYELLKGLNNVSLSGFNEVEVTDFYFNQNIREKLKYGGDERERTYNFYRLNEYHDDRVEGKYQMPALQACHYIPENLISFKYVKNIEKIPPNCGVHFFVDDYQFERFWSSPNKIIARLSRFACTFTPDFSLYIDMPLPMKMWNIYRSRLLGQMMQDAGLQVIPTLTWADEETFQFCFDGIASGGVVAVSNIGVMRDTQLQEIWRAGMRIAMKKLKPECILFYGYNRNIDFDFGDTKVKFFEGTVFK